MKLSRHITGNGLLALLLAAWWLLNVWQAAATELADDEAYYWFFSQALDWGYYDHPPMVALLVWLTSFLPGELGVRLAATLLQPLYLYLFWTLIRPQQPSWREAWLYFLICFSIPMLQLYGFIAVPDAPLLFFTVAFLWSYRRYECSGTLANATLMAVAMALLVYSKYHGVLVIFFVLLSNPRLLGRWRTYYAAIVALLLFLPHLWWQYQHDFATFRYHLVERSGDARFQIGNIAAYLLAMVAVFNPLWTIGGCWMRPAAHKAKVGEPDNAPLRRALVVTAVGFVLFFLLAACRDKTQPQWLLPVVFPLMAYLFYAASHSDAVHRFVQVAGIVCALILVVARVLVVVNPCQWKGELWNNRTDNQALAAWAAGRPILFCDDYTYAAKYRFYTHQPAYAQSVFFGRTSQWQYCNWDDTLFASRHCDAIVNPVECSISDTLLLPSGRQFAYLVMPHYLPIRKVRVEPVETCCSSLHEGEPLTMTLDLYNPYNYDLVPSEERPLWVTLFWRNSQHDQPEAHCPITGTLPAHGHLRVKCSFAIPDEVTDGKCECGFSLRYAQYKSVCSSKIYEMALQRDCHGIQIKVLK